MTRLCEFPGSLGTISPSRLGIEAERAQWAKQRGEASETARSGADAATMRASRTGSPNVLMLPQIKTKSRTVAGGDAFGSDQAADKPQTNLRLLS